MVILVSGLVTFSSSPLRLMVRFPSVPSILGVKEPSTCIANVLSASFPDHVPKLATKPAADRSAVFGRLRFSNVTAYFPLPPNIKTPFGFVPRIWAPGRFSGDVETISHVPMSCCLSVFLVVGPGHCSAREPLRALQNKRGS